MLQGIRLPTDENAGLFSRALDKENAGNIRKPVLSGKPGQPLGGARRALGNITNLKGAGGADKDENASTSGKEENNASRDSALPVRRAFGDITNRAPQSRQADVSISKPKPVPVAPSSSASSGGLQGSRTASGLSNSRRPEVIRRGVSRPERLAGKGWEQLEAERVAQEEMMIAERVKASALVLPASRPALLEVYSDAASESDEDVPFYEVEIEKPVEKSAGGDAAHNFMSPCNFALDLPSFEDSDILDDLVFE